MAFPCNQFGNQEPKSDAEIKKFARDKMNATFPLFDKIEVNGDGAIPLYKNMKGIAGGGEVKWNFEKFLLDKKGNVIRRYRSKVQPDDIADDIQTLLDDKPLSRKIVGG